MPLVIAVRAESERDAGHIEGSVLAPTPDIRHRYGEWDPEAQTVVLCNTGNRSMTAASLLRQRGFRRVYNVLGGTTAWAANGYPLRTGSGE